MPRRTHAQVRDQAVRETREATIAKMCRVLRYHLGRPAAADQLWDAVHSGEALQQTGECLDRWYCPYDFIGPPQVTPELIKKSSNTMAKAFSRDT